MNDFLHGLTGTIVTPFDPVYSEARQGYNRAIQRYPLIIVYCQDKYDVSNAVIWSRQHKVPIRVRSGGHNYEGYSNGDCTLVIDVSQMNDMKINERENYLYVQGGVTNKLVYEFMASKGYPFPGGTCPTVGVSGYALGGGWGLSCRLFGLGCDNLLQIEMVNYEGKIITANDKCNSDLFWACRGAGGGNYGVIVSMIFRLPPRVNKVTLIEIDYLNVSESEQKAFLHTWQEWLRTADPRSTLISRIYNAEDDGLSMLVRGIFYGKPDEAKRIIGNFLELDGAIYNFEYLTFLEAVTIIGSSYPPFEKFKSVSRFVLKNFTDSEISELVGLIQKRPQGSVFAGLSMYALGGKVAQVGVDETAFYYRNARYIIWLETVWEENEYAKENIAWIREQFPTLEQATKGSYINFPYGELENYLNEYYGCHVKALKKIKKKYDPYNIFTFPQGFRKVVQQHQLPHFVHNLPQTGNENMKQSNNVSYRGFRYVSKKETDV